MISRVRLWGLDFGPWTFIRRTQRKKIEPDLHANPRFNFFAFLRGNALLEQLAIQFETDRGDVAALFSAQKIAGAANFKVAHRDFESAPEGRVLLDGAEAFADVRDQSAVPGEEAIGIRLVLRPAN